MFQILPESAGPLVCIKVTGKLTDPDYERFIPAMEAVIAAHGKIRLYADLEDFEGWEWHAAWDDFAFGIKHWNDIERMALVGTKRWEDLAAKIADRLMPAEVRFFPVDDKAAALAWVR
jgi:hypothetical protein